MAKQANKKQTAPKPVEVKLPSEAEDRPAWARAGVFAAVGLAVGIAWPTVAGMRVGPEVPGAKAVPDDTAIDPLATAAMSATPPEPPTSASASPNAAADGAATPGHRQRVVVGGGTIIHCFEGDTRLKGEACGALAIDPVLAPRLEQLASCPSALGLEGEMALTFDVDFKQKAIRVLKGPGGELPGSTINGVLACGAEAMAEIPLEKVVYKHSKYRVEYNLKFYPPGAAIHTEGAAADDAESATERSRGMGTVAWDSALVRSEPQTGDVVTRLVRGTRVTLMGRRKDWYRVKVGSKDGWIYRGALGM